MSGGYSEWLVKDRVLVGRLRYNVKHFLKSALPMIGDEKDRNDLENAAKAFLDLATTQVDYYADDGSRCRELEDKA